MTLKSILFFAGTVWFLAACTHDPLDVDASDVTVELGFCNVDSMFVHGTESDLLKAHHEFKSSITDMYDLEMGRFLRVGDLPDSLVFSTIDTFRNDPYISRLEKRIQEKFASTETIKVKLIDGFKHLKFHVSDTKLPTNVVFLNTLFNASAPATENEIGVGLERYLGAETDVIKELTGSEFHQWMKEAWRREFLERDVLTSWIVANVIEEQNGGSLAENIVYWGKVLYFVEACFPEDDHRLIVRYSQDDFDWAVENEASYWKYLVDQNLLFKIDEKTKMNMLKDGPFTPGLPKKGPDRLGQFLGWRMVGQFMKENDISLKELLEVEYNEILQNFEIE
ncbi:MAG: hypothetical protein MK066_05175 [Crocinitomicaceae bacterium]|nr:hypothetical protein [Crocinitomicaceae bacterium]